MRAATVAGTAALAAALAACGGAPLPADDGPLAGPPVLAPLGTGARWTYRVTDPVKGVFDKDVVVLGPAAVPESSAAAIEVRDTEPTGEETAWVGVEGGFLVRHREEDRRAGVLVRATTWTPGAPKTLAVEARAGFTARITVNEREWHPDDTVSTKSPVYRFTVVATGVKVTVPAGTFSCVQVERERLDKVDPKRTYWLAPGVGKVREEGERVEELRSYVAGT
ncbi:MAG TPA: hypothetical protein VFL83_15035 [Anaeromyxobacter sp.]|nr:hypothetical protein [Anaeromyxobacter sp.]